MKKVTVELPKLGESIVEATIVRFWKKEGDWVALDEPLLEVATDKINSEIPSPVKGRVEKILVEPDQLVKVGESLVILVTEIEEGKEAPSEKMPQEPVVKKEGTSSSFYSPAVIRLAQENQIPLEDLPHIPRKGDRLTKKDIEAYLADKSTERQKGIKMSPLRKAIAENLVKSFYQAPHASLITQIDVTDILQEIAQKKVHFWETHQAKLTITTYFARALCKVLQKYPHLNASLEGDVIFLKKGVNLGIAVSIEGGVIVPVIQNCDSLTLPQIAKEIAQLASLAKQQKLSSDQVQGGTITLTNFGMGGTLIGIPIIHHPEVAIVGMGAIQKVVKVGKNEEMVIRSVLHVSLTFDHRVIDGMYGCSFLQALQEEMEQLPPK